MRYHSSLSLDKFQDKKKLKRKNKNAKSEPKQSPRKSAWSMALWALGILLFLLLLSKAVGFAQSLFSPLSHDLIASKNYTWNGKTSFNVVFQSDQTEIVNFDPINRNVTILRVPSNAYIPLPKGFGTWPVGSIYQLGQAEKEPIGAPLLEKSLSNMLGLPIDGFVLMNNKETTAKETIESWHSNYLSIIAFLRSSKTNLTPLETVRLIWGIAGVRADKITYLDLERSNITESKLLPDSSRVLGVDTIALDLFIRDKVSDPSIVSEESTVSILNATDEPGLASQVARVVTNMGGTVIMISNTLEQQEQTKIIKNPQDFRGTYTLDRLTQIYAPWCQAKGCSSADPKVTNSRANIIIVVGSDYFKRNNDRQFAF